ncbi:beta strand repeat-containing protein [Sphingomonas sp. DT-207]|uniref:beta strand repeat-containing protein n=1 Tax=Sphingomonas sp. DT-207 TaxID=3396167 RepID=UPI003F1AC27B
MLPADSAAYTLGGVVAGDQVFVAPAGINGSYASKDVATGINVNATGIALGGTAAGNYSIASTLVAAPVGEITPATLTAAIINDPTKTYDGTNIATLTSTNYLLTGFVSGEGATVTETSGTYDSFNAGARTVNVGLLADDFTADPGTLLSNYILPTSATGAGTIERADLVAAIVNNPTKTYDGSVAAALASLNFRLNGFVSGEGATVTQTAGTYASPNAGSHLVTASLAASDFTANSGTLLDNYNLPTSATGIGTIDPRALTAAIIGNPTKIYDGNTAAALTSANFELTGFVTGEGAIVIETVGAYDDPNAGLRTVSATLDGGDFTANSGTLLSNYVLPTSASGAGTIGQKALTAAIIGNPTKPYDGTNAATLAAANYQLTGFVGSESATVTQTAGSYASANAGAWLITAMLAGGDFTAGGGTNLANYVLPTQAEGMGTIDRLALSAAIIGNPTKIYDGTVAATLASGNYQLTGFIAGEGGTVTETVGTYDSKDAGPRTVTATLDAADFTANSGTLLDNYILPVSASGAGTISQKLLTAVITGLPTKVYDATTAATLTSSNFALSGFVAGEGATVTETVGAYGSPDAGIRIVTAALDGGDFSANGGTLLSNYVLPTSATGAGIIQKAALNAIIIGNPTKTYDATIGVTLTSANYLLTGFVGGQGATITETVGAYNSPNAGARIVTALLGSADFVADGGTDLRNYALPASAAGAGTINQATLTAAIIGNPTKTYDGTTVATLASGNYQLTGFMAGEGATVTETAGTYDDPNAGSRTVSATLDGGDFAATGSTLLSNYVLPTSASGAGTIGQAMLTAAIIGNPTKVYDGTTGATLASGNYQLSGFVAGEGATVTETMGSYGSPNVGIRTVTAMLDGGDFIADAGTLLSNYVLPASASGLGTISQAMLTAAIIGNPTKVYDGTTAATLASGNYQLSGFIAGEGAVVTETVGSYGSPNAGIHTVSATLDGGDFTADAGTLLSNYVLPTSASGLGTINQATLTAAIIGNPTKVYDATTAATLVSGNYQLSGFVAGEGATVTEAMGSYGSPNAGIHTVSAALDGGDFVADAGTLLSNYVLPTSASGLGTITQAMLTAAIIGNPTKTYDGTTAAVLASGNYQLSGFVAGEGATVTQTAGTYDEKNAGARIVTAVLAGGDFTADAGTLLSNYVLPASATGAGTIDPKELTVAILGTPTKVYDGTTAAALSTDDFRIFGFVAGEGVAIGSTISGTYAGRNVGLHALTIDPATANITPDAGTLLSNYVLRTGANGIGRITPAPLTATLADVFKIYDGNTAATLTPTNFTLTGFVTGEGATVTQTAGVYDEPNAGSRTVTAALAAGDFVANGGTLLSNYTLPTTASGSGTIGQALLTAAIIGNPTKVYDGTAAAVLGSANYQLTGFVAGEGATVDQAAGLYDSANAGARTVTTILAAGDFTANGGTLLSNYVLPTSASGMGTISQAMLTAAIVGNPTKTYDGNTAAVLASTNFALTGFVAGEGATVTHAAGTYDNKNAGSRTVSASLAADDFSANSGTLLSNYVLPASATGAGTIDRADLTVAITGRPTKDYDGNTDATLTSADYSITGFVAGEGATITETSGTYASPDPGEQLVTAILAADDYTADAGTLLSNYNLPTQAVGEGEIIATAPPPCSDGLLDCLPPNLAFRLAVTSRQHFFIPFPTLYPMYQGITGAFAGMPSIVTYPSVMETSGGMLIVTGSTVINSGDQILNQMGGSRTIRIEYPPLRPIDYEGVRP